MRLTKKVEDKAVFHVCDKTCLACNGTSCGFTQAIVDRLAAIEDAEEQGRLVILPCKVGDMVFKPFLRPLSVVPMVVLRIILDGIDNQIIVDGGRSVCFCDIGKTVFLTREEAEAALKGETEDV